MHKVLKWPNIREKSCSVNTTRYLKYVSPFYIIMYERVNTAAKYLLMNSRKHGNKRVLGIKWFMSCLNTHIFISFYNGNFFCLIFQVQIHFFSFRPLLSYCRYYHIVKNVDCVFLASLNNRHKHIHNNREWLKQPQSHFH